MWRISNKLGEYKIMFKKDLSDKWVWIYPRQGSSERAAVGKIVQISSLITSPIYQVVTRCCHTITTPFAAIKPAFFWRLHLVINETCIFLCLHFFLCLRIFSQMVFSQINDNVYLNSIKMTIRMTIMMRRMAECRHGSHRWQSSQWSAECIVLTFWWKCTSWVFTMTMTWLWLCVYEW